MTTIEDGTIVMDTDFAPVNSETEIVDAPETIHKFVILETKGTMEDHVGLILEESEDLDKLLKADPSVRVIATGECYCSLAELNYTVQSPTRQLYRATMADIKELLGNRFTKDDEFMRAICNASNEK
jgi:hypothetical protein